jgi:hypothetical protein
VKVVVDSKEAEHLAVAVQHAVLEAEADLQATAPVLAAVAEQIIMHSIASIPKIGPFMAARTSIDTTFTPGNIVLTISGMTEEEAGIEGVAKPENNLWDWHEYGASSDAGGLTTYEKDVGGVKAQRKSKAAGVGSKYKGVVKDTVSGLTFQLQEALQAVWTTAGVVSVDRALSKATRGKVKIPTSARAAFKRAGFSPSSLASIGVQRIEVSAGGQIKAIGSSGYIPMKSRGMPTTIRTR